MICRQTNSRTDSYRGLLEDSPLNVEYEVLALIGQGSFGKVYRAQRRLDSEFVALKIFTKDPSNPKNSHQEHYFRQECSLLRSFKHPNILKFVDFYENSSFIFLVVEHCSGGDLKQYLDCRRSTAANEKEIAIICRAALKGLDYLHQKRSVIHRDIKLGSRLSPQRTSWSGERSVLESPSEKLTSASRTSASAPRSPCRSPSKRSSTAEPKPTTRPNSWGAASTPTWSTLSPSPWSPTSSSSENTLS